MTLDERGRAFSREISYLPDHRREEIEVLWERMAEDFLRAPASSKISHHHCYEGGLAVHSLETLKYARKIANALPGARNDASLTIASLFHDLGKADGYYVPIPTTDRRYREGVRYTYNADWHRSHEQRSLYLLQLHGVSLSEEEYLAILLHNGQYTPTSDRFSMHEPPLALILHWADLWSARGFVASAPSSTRT